MGGARIPSAAHQRKRRTAYAKKGKRALSEAVQHNFAPFSFELVDFLSREPGAVRTASKSVGVCEVTRYGLLASVLLPCCSC